MEGGQKRGVLVSSRVSASGSREYCRMMGTGEYLHPQSLEATPGAPPPRPAGHTSTAG